MLESSNVVFRHILNIQRNIRAGKFEKQPVGLSEERERELEYQIFAELNTLLNKIENKRKYEDIEVTYKNDTSVELTLVDFYRNGRQVDNWRFEWSKSSNIFPKYSISSHLLSNDIIKAVFPMFGERIFDILEMKRISYTIACFLLIVPCGTHSILQIVQGDCKLVQFSYQWWEWRDKEDILPVSVPLQG